MGPNDIIELLSSDNEIPVPPLSRSKPKATLQNRATGDFLFLSDDSEDPNEFDHERAEGPSKRRKLSPSPFREVDNYVLPILPSIHQSLPSNGLAAQGQRSKNRGCVTLDGSDPIEFTSSLRESASRARRRAVEKSFSNSELSDDSLPDDLLSAPTRSKPSGLSARTSALLDRLSQPAPRAKPGNLPQRPTDEATKTSERRSRDRINGIHSSSADEQDTVTAKIPKAPRKSKLTEEEQIEKAREKERDKALKAKIKENVKVAAKEQKAKEKEEDQERKRLLKEERFREKRIAADLAEVNKSKLDKKDSTIEMIVDLPASIDGQSVDTQSKQFLKNLSVDATLYQSPIPNVIKWRRKMKARWNAELDHWEPMEQMEIHEEKHVMCLMPAKEFVTLAMEQNDGQDIDTHVAKLKSAFNGCIPIYLVEGLHVWMRKNKTAENRAYQAKVNSLTQGDDLASTGQPISRKKKPAVEIVDEDLIEDTLLRLQIMHCCLVHHTSAPLETAEWVANFTQHISTIPYRYVSTQALHVLTLRTSQDPANESGDYVLHGVRSSQDRRRQG